MRSPQTTSAAAPTPHVELPREPPRARTLVGGISSLTVAVAAVAVATAGCAGAGLRSRPATKGAVVRAFSVADVDANLAYAEQQILKAENRLGVGEHPRYTATHYKGGQWDTNPATDWRSGFFTGTEWMMYENFGDNANKWRALAEERTANFDAEMGRPQNHDIGFKAVATYGLGYKLTNRADYVPKILEAANTLADRFSPEHGVTRSWDDPDSDDFRVIVDNMMNLEVFFLAAELTARPADRERWLNMAVSHAKKTEENQVRDSADPNIDGSTCHVYFYNKKVCHTRQGLSHSSTWTRGQSWTMYGFAMSYRYAKRWPQYSADAKLFLATAVRTSDLYLRRLAEPKNEDWIPLHDFDSPQGGPKDTSAAALAASALVELSTIAELPAAKRALYKAAAESTLHDLSSTAGAKPYRTNVTAADLSQEPILLRGTTAFAPGAAGEKEVEAALSYGEYYYVEALLRYKDSYGKEPRPPGFLVGTRGENSVALAWQGTRGAASYAVKRAGSAAGPFAAVGGTSEAHHTDKTAAAGQPYAYVVTATNFAGVESAPSNVANLPVSGFANADVGDVTPPGGSIEEGGTFTVKGAGVDIWDNADAFHFMYKRMSGNGTAMVRLVNIQDTHIDAKSGIMMRESTTAGSKYVFVGLTPTAAHGYRLQSRSSTDGVSQHLKIGSTQTPAWLRLIRSGKGKTFSASYSTDGKTFLSAGTVTVDLPRDILVGLAVSSHANGMLNAATFDNLTLP